MLGNDYDSQTCSIAGALGVVGERWSLLIVRNVFLGLRRFDEIQENLGIARNVLQTRLTRLLDHGVLEKRLYQEHPPRYVPDAGPAVLIEHRGCGGAIDEHRVCRACGKKLSVRDARALPGPSAPANHPLLRRDTRAQAA